MKKILYLLVIAMLVVPMTAFASVPDQEPKVRLTSMCSIEEGTGVMRFREEGGAGPITWHDNYGNNGVIQGGETVFFEVPSPGTVIVQWTGPNNTSGSTVKAQNTKPCEDPCSEFGGDYCPAPVHEPKCNPDNRLWVWDLLGTDGRWRQLLDRGYDGSYFAPGKIMQCYYFGCDFQTERVWGHYVSECDAVYALWNGLPFGSGGGQCPLQ